LKPLLNVSEVARLLNCSRGSIYRAALKKEIPAVRIPGAGVRFDLDDLQAWIAAKKRDAEGRSLDGK
jgi:excisionase family DNA binding protein